MLPFNLPANPSLATSQREDDPFAGRILILIYIDILLKARLAAPSTTWRTNGTYPRRLFLAGLVSP